MTIYPHEAFVYLWHHGPTKTYYLGFHRGTPDDGYAHSSSALPEWDANNPPPGWRRRILAYGTAAEMYQLEHSLLKKRAKYFRKKYHNRVVWGGNYALCMGEKSPEMRERIRNTMKGTRVGEDNPMYGKSQKESTRNKIAAKARERKRGWVTEPDGTTHLIDPTTFVLPEGWLRGRVVGYIPKSRHIAVKSRTIRHDLVTPPLIGL